MATYPLASLIDMPAARDDVVRMASQAFGIARDATERWVGLGGDANWRLLIEGSAPAACLLLVPMGQYVGGARVSMTGIAGVAVPPEARGRGVAANLLTATVRELHQSGVALSTLYSAMHPLYRRVGYETAGVLCRARVPAAMFPATDRGAGWKPFDAARDLDGVRACAAAFAREQQGYVDRGPYLWERVQRPRGAQTEAFVARAEDGTVEAYVFYLLGGHDPEQPGTGSALGNVLDVQDFAWSTPRGLTRLQGFLRGFSSVVGDVNLFGGVDSPLLMGLDDRRFRVRVRDQWMLRVTHVQTALTQRRYPVGLGAQIDLDLDDPTLPEQAGRWRLTLDGSGAARCERGGDGRLALSARSLAPLYTGHMSATRLASAGWVQADASTLAACDAAFAPASAPAMADAF